MISDGTKEERYSCYVLRVKLNLCGWVSAIERWDGVGKNGGRPRRDE